MLLSWLVWEVQVRKSFEEKRRKRTGQGQGRAWKLKRMNMDVDDGMVLKKGQQQQADRRQQDLERFMQVSCTQHEAVMKSSPHIHASVQIVYSAIGTDTG